MVSTSNLPDSSNRPFGSSFNSQSPSSPAFHHSGGMQGLHNNYGSFSVANMQASLSSRNTAAVAAAMSGVPSSGMQQAGGGISSGRFTGSNIPASMPQISHGHSGMASISVVGNSAFSSSMNGVAGSLPGMLSNSVAASNRNTFSGLGASPILGNVGSRITSPMGNIGGGGNIGRSISSGGLSLSGLTSRVNLASNSGSGSLNLQGSNRLMNGMLQQAPQMLGMLGNLYPTSGGPLSQNQVQAGNTLGSMGMLNDVNSNDNSPLDLNDFPQLSARPNSAGGSQRQLGSLRKQGVSSIVQQNQEFTIQNEDFPALPGFKGRSFDFPMDLHQKDQLHDNVSMLQSQHFPMARSGGFSLGGNYQSSRQQHGTSVSSSGVTFAPRSNQDLIHLRGSDLFPSTHESYHSENQNSGHPNIGLRPSNSANPASGMGAYDQLMQQYQHPQNQSQFRLQQISSVNQSHRDQSLKSLQGSQTTHDRFGLHGLLSVIRMNDPELTSLALGIDLTTLGLNLNSTDNLYKAFASPWSDEPARGEPGYSIPSCYNAKQPTPLQQGHFSRFQLSTLFYIFYSMPRDEAQLYAANELYQRGWAYHKQIQLWFSELPHTEPLVKTQQYERGVYLCFDPNTWETVRKENFVVYYDAVEKKPALPQR